MEDEIYMEKDIILKIEKHKEWHDSFGQKERKGEKFYLEERVIEGGEWENICMIEGRIIDCTFRNIVLNNWDFYFAMLCSTCFKEMEIVSSEFVKANLDYTQFVNTRIIDSNFSKADFYDSSFTNVRIESSKFINCSFSDACFKNVYLKKVDFDGACIRNVLFDSETILEDVSGLDNAFVKSINIGSMEEPVYLKEKEALKWLIDRNSCKGE